MKLAFTDYGGDGTPIVILHGLFGSGRNWASFARQQSGSNRILAVDLRNHGASPWDALMDYPAMADDVLELIGSELGGKAIVLGHSMGAKTAMTAALTKPEAVQKLIVVDSAPVAYGHSHAGYVDLLRALDLTKISRRAEADAALADSVPQPELRGFLLHNLNFGDDGPRWQLNLDAIQPNLEALMSFPFDPGAARYDGPALFIGGGKSKYILPEYHAAIHDYFPAAGIEMIEGATHWVHAIKPEEFSRLVNSFLD
jgi:pimeloyl-ACP methyl ester carboxylesterase